MSQLKTLFGISIPNDGKVLHTMLYNFFANITSTHWPTLVFGIICLLFFCIFNYGWITIPWRGKKKRISFKRFPSGLFMVVLGTLSIYLVKVIGNYKPDAENLTEVYGIKICGQIPPGLPLPTFPLPSDMSWEKFQEVFLASLPIIMIGYLEVLVYDI